MLAIQATSKTVVYLHMEQDNGINKGGYYCEVYEGNDKNSRLLDQFTIPKSQIIGTDMRERDNRGRKYAMERIKNTFKRGIR